MHRLIILMLENSVLSWLPIATAMVIATMRPIRVSVKTMALN